MKRSLALTLLTILCYTTFAQNYTVLGSGNHAINPNAFVYSLATDANGNLYAATGFAGSGIGTGAVEKWDGTTWSELASPSDSLKANGVVRRVITDAGNDVFAAGDFLDNTTNGFYVAKWNGTTWSAVNNTSTPHFNNGNIFAIDNDAAGNIYAAETYDTLGGAHYNYITKWDGTNWHELGAGANPFHPDSIVFSITHDGSGNLYAVGQFTDSLHRKYVAKWDGTSWSQLGGIGYNNTIKSVITDAAGKVYIAGDYTSNMGGSYIAKWNGTNWGDLGNSATELDLESNNRVSQLAIDGAGNIYAAGRLADSIGQYVAKWDGTSWTKLHTDTVRFETITLDGSGNVYGAYPGVEFIGQPSHAIVARLNFTPVGIAPSPTEQQQLNIYPNPTNQSLTITTKLPLATIELMNTLGQASFVEQYNQPTNQVNINVGMLANGIYFVRATDSNGNVHTSKFVKQ